ncbi:MAG: hypothetical protein ACD_75C00360G0001 [uncultured bacterium]|nr:MAG: hypothetical protein ACD_75C00360G0001 [uncultured bacterium]
MVADGDGLLFRESAVVLLIDDNVQFAFFHVGNRSAEEVKGRMGGGRQFGGERHKMNFRERHRSCPQLIITIGRIAEAVQAIGGDTGKPACRIGIEIQPPGQLFFRFPVQLPQDDCAIVQGLGIIRPNIQGPLVEVVTLIEFAGLQQVVAESGQGQPMLRVQPQGCLVTRPFLFRQIVFAVGRTQPEVIVAVARIVGDGFFKIGQGCLRFALGQQKAPVIIKRLGIGGILLQRLLESLPPSGIFLFLQIILALDVVFQVAAEFLYGTPGQKDHDANTNHGDSDHWILLSMQCKK